MDKRIVIAIDPGDRNVGIAVYDNGKFESFTYRPREAIEFIEDALVYAPCIMVVEEYRLYLWKSTAQSFSEMKTAEMIGVIKYLSRKSKTPIYMQRPVDVKRFSNNTKLKRLGWYDGSTHAKDAARHLLYFFKTNEEGKKIWREV